MSATALKASELDRMAGARAGVVEARFSPTVIRFCWVCFISLHLAGLLYYSAAAWCYWNLPGTRLDAWLTMYNLGIGVEYDGIIAIPMGCIAVIHGFYVVWMLVWSFKKRQLAFAVYNVIEMPKCLLQRGGSRKGVVHPKANSKYVQVYEAFFTRDGIFGIDGPYFDMILFCREIMDTTLQTYQAYRMSLLLPRAQINRWYVGLLVINCWTIALVHSAFRSNSTKRRVWSLISDCILSTVVSMGISTVLVASYINDFEFQVGGFSFHKWYEDVWVVHATSEFKLVLVTSWSDLCTRIIFAFGLLGNMDSIKMAMRARRSKDKQRGNRATMIAPFLASPKPVRGPAVGLLKRKPRKAMLSKISQMAFFAWGLVIFTLHLYAESSPQPPQCWMQVKPWMSLQSSCSLLVLDCNQDQLSGTKKEVELQWSAFDPKTVVRVVVKHCPALELSEILKTFSGLNAIKIYNSTIVTWDSSAAITQADHPNLMTLFLVRVTFPNGELPLGLQANDFPQTLGDIEFCVTNLNSLPGDLELKWPQYASIYIEASQLTEVPESLVRLAPYDLSLSMNPITTLPAELFEQDTVAFLSFGSTLISQLPEKVTKLSSLLRDVNLSYTNVSFFWSWIDPIVAQAEYPLLSLAHTPYCWNLKRIFAGEQMSFSVLPPPSKNDVNVSILSDPSRRNWATLRNAVTCEEQQITTWYPIELEDQYSGLT